jgi:diaminohydroxyphosphoribosylaminopyrimidine deaminase/5-amino-6-(5-phosphoribosylamino)uracil reductase
MPHAEVEAISDAGGSVRGADMYVTLEPCSRYGRTPPCTDALIASGIRRVWVASTDPNPEVRGRGVRKLRASGIEVSVGLERAAARDLNAGYFKFMNRGLPFVTLKTAQTLDGRIATTDGRSKWITSPAARRSGRELRGRVQAVVVGSKTVLCDDPRLLPPRNRTGLYYRCVLDSNLSIPYGAQLVTGAVKVPTIVYCAGGPASKRRKLERSGVIVHDVGSAGSRVDARAVTEDLASRGVMDVIVEGGGSTASSFLESGVVDRIVAFIAPKVMGDVGAVGGFRDIRASGPSGTHRFRVERASKVGPDIMIVLRSKG